MKNEFFTQSYIDNNPLYKSSAEYLSYVIADIANECCNGNNYSMPSRRYVLQEIIRFFGPNNIYLDRIENFIDENFIAKDDSKKIYLSNQSFSAIFPVKQYIKNSITLENKSRKELKQSLRSLADAPSSSIGNLISYAIAYDHSLTNQEYEYYSMKLFNVLTNGADNKIKSLDKNIAKIDPARYNDYLNLYVKKPGLLDLFLSINVKTVRDLFWLYTPTIFGIFILYIYDIDSLIACLSLQSFMPSKILDTLYNTFAFLKDREERVLVCHRVFNLSYSEIGKKENLTYIGCRQIDLRAERLLLNEIFNNSVFYVSFFRYITIGLLDVEKFIRVQKTRDRILLVLSLLHASRFLSTSEYLSALYEVSAQRMKDVEAKNPEFEKVFHAYFKSCKYDTISCNVFYRTLLINHPDILESMGDAGKNEEFLFSYIKKNHPMEYLFSAPFISKRINESITATSLIYDLLKDKNDFTYDEAKYIMDYYDIPHLYFKDVIDYASATHILVNNSEMVKKESFDINQDQLEEIDQLLTMFTSKENCIDTRVFNAYSLFPNLKYKWNKYLLYGITRTYFSDKYECKNTTNGFKNANYLIRRIDHERK